MATSPRTPELALPVASLAAIRDSLVSSVGPEAAALALRQAGHAAGDALHRILSSGGDTESLAALPADRFWAQLSRLFSSRGWGQLTYSQVHSGVGSLEATNWAEARVDAAAGQPSCHFTTGVLANLLGQIANAEVAVLEAECRSRGDHRCRFLFGGADAVFAVYERIAAGDEPDAALARLGWVARIIGIDYGERRVGVAISDPTATIAQPLTVLTRRTGKRPPVQAIADLAAEHGAAHIVIGLPLTLEGNESDWTREVRAFGDKLAARAGIGVSFADERMTSVVAERAVRSLGLKRRQREQKERVDAAAAMIILQAYLDQAGRQQQQ